MLFKIYTKYLDQKPVYHGTFETPDETAANLYAYKKACDVFSQHETEIEMSTFEDYHEALFSTVDFWIE